MGSISGSAKLMGGIGSGRHGRRSTRSRIEDLARVSVGQVLGQGSWPLSVSGTSAGLIRVVQWTVGTTTYDLKLTSTPQRLGGRRWWLVCPSCRMRRKDLYHVRSRADIGCRVCLRLTYTSQGLSRADRWQYQAESLFDKAELLRICQVSGRGITKSQSRIRKLLTRASAYEEAWVRDGLSRLPRSLVRMMISDK